MLPLHNFPYYIYYFNFFTWMAGNPKDCTELIIILYNVVLLVIREYNYYNRYRYRSESQIHSKVVVMRLTLWYCYLTNLKWLQLRTVIFLAFTNVLYELSFL